MVGRAPSVLSRHVPPLWSLVRCRSWGYCLSQEGSRELRFGAGADAVTLLTLEAVRVLLLVFEFVSKAAP